MNEFEQVVQPYLLTISRSEMYEQVEAALGRPLSMEEVKDVNRRWCDAQLQEVLRELRTSNEERIHELESLIASYEEGDDLEDLSNQMEYDSLIWELEALQQEVRDGETTSNES